VTITFNPTGSEWTVAGSFNGNNFTTTNATFTDNTYTGVDTSYLGPYIRNQASNTAPSLTLQNMTVAVPEPSTYALLAGLATLGLILLRRRQ
jgi:hypothetical protein